MSLRGESGCECNPELIFEFVDGALEPRRRRELRSHLDECPGCRERYEREVEMSACLGSLELSEPSSVHREVAMALPTRSAKVRFVWALLALGLLSAASLALMANGGSPLVFALNALDTLWGFVSSFADAAQMLVASAGPVILVALAAGAVVDFLIAGVVISMRRREV